MKTRIIHTKIYFEDDWFYSLSIENKFLFIYLISNSHIGLTGIYNLPKRVILLETGLKEPEIDEGRKIFEESGKIYSFKDWVYIVNARRYANYTGEKNITATNRELESIPLEVMRYFTNTVSIPYTYPMDTPINHKSKIINQKSEIERVGGKKVLFKGNTAILEE